MVKHTFHVVGQIFLLVDFIVTGFLVITGTHMIHLNQYMSDEMSLHVSVSVLALVA